MSSKTRPSYEFGPFLLDPAERLLLRNGETVPLTPKAFEVLVLLIEEGGRLVGKEELMNRLWPDSFVQEANLTNSVYAIRKALGGGQGEETYVENVPKHGYRFVAEVRVVPEALQEVLVVEKHTLTRLITEEEEETQGRGDGSERVRGAESRLLPAPARRRLSGSALAVLSVLVIAAAVAAFAYFKYSNRSGSQAITSIAVLPFANASADQNMEYLADGLSESLINTLSQLPQLKVIARSSTFDYKGQEVNPQEVARALGVQAMLMGRVVQRGDSLVVSVELVDARDQTQVWGAQYTRRAADLQGVQEEIAHTISEKLRLRLSGAQEQQLTKRATQNPQAYDLYLNGLFYVRKSRKENASKALDYFNQAIALDPNFALAWVGVARAHRNLAAHSQIDAKEVLAKAKASAQKALELDETLADAHAMMGAIKQNEWDWAGAEPEYKRAIELNPNSADAHYRYSEYLSPMGRHTEALAEIKHAQGLDPLRDTLRDREVMALILARRYDEALEKLENANKLKPDSANSALGFVYATQGMYEQAIIKYKKSNSIDGETTTGLCYLGYALAMSGKRSEAQTILDKLKNANEYVSPTELAVIYAGLGDEEGAFALLERAYAAHDIPLQYLKVDPHFDSLRSDPRFADLLRRMRFAP